MIEFAENNDFTTMVLIQATSPLLTKEHLQEGLQKYRDGDYDSMLSVVRQKRFIWSDERYASPVNYD
jgi:N-acylneuraminate cytidylyltransferase